MNSFENIREDVVSLARASALAVALAATACSGGASEAPETTPAPPETTVPAVDYCAAEAQTDPLLPFDGSGFFETTQYTYFRDKLEVVNAAVPEATPQEFANQYVQTYGSHLGEQGIQVIFDESLGFTVWQDGETDYGMTKKDAQQRDISFALDPVIDTIDDYPPGMLPALGVTTIRLSEESGDAVGGRFRSAESEIQFEYKDSEDKVRTSSLSYIAAHEIGHAMHAHYCNLYIDYDEELMAGIEFIDAELVEKSQSEVEAMASTLPSEQFAYGPDRVFPTSYSALSGAEYFADMVSFTFETRGLILSQDADYGSTLQQKQQLVVERLEKLFPGVTEFLERHTQVLRMDPSLEIYDDIPEVKISQAEINSALDQVGGNDNLVLDGFMLDPWSIGRAADVTPYPLIKRDSFGDLSVYNRFSESGSSSFPLNVSADSVGNGRLDIVVYTKNPDAILTNQGNTEAFAWSGVAQDSVWVGDPAMQPLLADIEAGKLKPVRLSIEMTVKAD